MEGKQPIKISLATVICLFIIFTLIVALVGMWCYYNLIDNKEESKNPNNELSGFEDLEYEFLLKRGVDYTITDVKKGTEARKVIVRMAMNVG